MSRLTTSKANLPTDSPHAKVSPQARTRAAELGYAMSDGSFPCLDRADVRRAVEAFPRARDKCAARLHIAARARALGCTELLPRSWREFENEPPPPPKLTSEIVASIRALPTDIPLPLLTTIYMRGVAITHSHELALQRLKDFLTGANAHTEDADLALVAAPFGAPGNFEEHEHPRGRDGRFIRKWGRVKIFSDWNPAALPLIGTVLESSAADPDHIQVRLTSGETVTVPASRIEGSDAKALLPDSHPNASENVDTPKAATDDVEKSEAVPDSLYKPGDILDISSADGTPYAIAQIQNANTDGTYDAKVTDHYDPQPTDSPYIVGTTYRFRADQLTPQKKQKESLQEKVKKAENTTIPTHTRATWEEEFGDDEGFDRLNDIRADYIVNDENTIKYNRELRNDTPSPEALEWQKEVDFWTTSGETSEDTVLYRGVALTDEQIDHLREQDFFVDPGSVSAGADPFIAEVYADARAKEGDKKFIYELHVPAGTSVGEANSGEYVFPTNTRFDVVSVSDDRAVLKVRTVNPFPETEGTSSEGPDPEDNWTEEDIAKHKEEIEKNRELYRATLLPEEPEGFYPGDTVYDPVGNELKIVTNQDGIIVARDKSGNKGLYTEENLTKEKGAEDRDSHDTPLKPGDIVETTDGITGIFEGRDKSTGDYMIGVLSDPINHRQSGALYISPYAEKVSDPAQSSAPLDIYGDRPAHFPAELLNGNTAAILSQGGGHYKARPTDSEDSGINSSAILTHEDNPRSQYFVKETSTTGQGGAASEVDSSRLYRLQGIHAPYVESGGHDHELVIAEMAGSSQGFSGAETLFNLFERHHAHLEIDLEELELADESSILKLGVLNLVARQGDRHSGNIMFARDAADKGHLIPIDNEFSFVSSDQPDPPTDGSGLEFYLTPIDFGYDHPLAQYTAKAPKEQRIQEIQAHLSSIEDTVQRMPWQSEHNKAAALAQSQALTNNLEAVYARLLGNEPLNYDISSEPGDTTTLDDFRVTKEDLNPGDVVYGPNGERLQIIGINADGSIIARGEDGKARNLSPNSISLTKPS